MKSEQNASHDAATHPGHVLPGAGLVVVDVDPLQLQVGITGVGSGGVDPVLIAGGEEDSGYNRTK